MSIAECTPLADGSLRVHLEEAKRASNMPRAVAKSPSAPRASSLVADFSKVRKSRQVIEVRACGQLANESKRLTFEPFQEQAIFSLPFRDRCPLC
eukprot:1681590-Pyramimonas_sp.AAC.2